MPAIVDREHGCFKQVVKPTGGTTYPYNFGELESQVGRKFDWYSTFVDFSVDYPTNPTPPSSRAIHKDIQDAAEAGHGLFIGFQNTVSYSNVGTPGGGYYPVFGTFDEMIAGVYDTKLSNFFTWVFSLGVPVIVRPFWEANLPESLFYPDDTRRLDGTRQPGNKPASSTYSSSTIWTTTGQPIVRSIQNYKDGFAYFVNFLRALPNGSTRFKSAYIPGANDPSGQVAKGGDGATLATMYPGNSVCDFVGYDSYNTLSSTKYFTPEETLRGYRESDSTNRYAYDIFQSIAPTKKIIIGEIACGDSGESVAPLSSYTNVADPNKGAVFNGHSKADWYSDFFDLGADFCPAIEKIMWFNFPGTRKTWPFSSSAPALESFQANFTSGTDFELPDPIDLGSDLAPDPSPSIAFPLSTGIAPGQGNHAAYHNKIHWLFNRTLTAVGDYFAGRFGSNGVQAALSVTTEMGSTASFQQFTPAVSFTMPVDEGSAVKYLMAVKTPGATQARWQKRSDGREDYGPGGTTAADLTTLRSAAGTFRIQGASAADATLDVANLTPKFVKLSDQTAPSSPGAGGVTLFGQNSAVYVRDTGGSFHLRPTQTELQNTAVVFSMSPDALVTGTSTGAAVTAGVLLTAKVRVTSTHTISTLGVAVTVAATGAGNAYMGLYDSTGALLASTSEFSANLGSTGWKKNAISGGPTINPGTYYITFLLGTGTALRVGGVANSLADYGGGRFGTYQTGLSALPSSITTGSINASGSSFCFTLN